jgi:hypothetical protein
VVTSLTQKFLLLARDLAKTNMADACLRMGLNAKTCDKLAKCSLSEVTQMPAESIRITTAFDAKMLDRLVTTKDSGTRSALVLVNRHGASR